jgi:cytochrome b561
MAAPEPAVLGLLDAPPKAGRDNPERARNDAGTGSHNLDTGQGNKTGYCSSLSNWKPTVTRNSSTQWGWPAKLLHWIGAVMILLLLVHGWWMTHLTPRPERLANYAGHSALGYDLLAILILRLLWRWFNPVPELPVELKPWERMSARLGHFLLYFFMLAVSLTGWLVATTARTPMTKDVFGLNVPPLLTMVDRSVRQWIEETHMVLAYVLAAVVVVHVMGALRHHLVKRNDVLRRMTWGMGV